MADASNVESLRAQLETTTARVRAASHDLRNAIGGLQAGVMLLRRKAQPQTVDPVLDAMERQLKALQRPLDDLQDAAG